MIRFNSVSRVLATVTAAATVAAVGLSSSPEPVNSLPGPGPCSVAYRLMNATQHGHSFGDVDGWNYDADVERDDSHWGAQGGQLLTAHHPYESCDEGEGGDTLPN